MKTHMLKILFKFDVNRLTKSWNIAVATLNERNWKQVYNSYNFDYFYVQKNVTP